MKKITYSFLWILTLQVIVFGCKEEDPQLAPAPSADEVTFMFEYDAENPNIVHFTNTSPIGFKAIWDFGTGITATGDEATAPFPVMGNYEVKLTLLTEGGNVSNTKTVNIAETNPLMLDIPSYNFLTGGVNNPDGKTWVVDKEVSAHLGVGPGEPCCASWATPLQLSTPDWYRAAPYEKDGKNLYDDEMTFNLSGFAYEHVVGNYVYVNKDWGSTFPGAFDEGEGDDFFAPYTPPSGSKWSLTDNEDGTYNLTLTNSEFMGYYHGANTYKITYLTADEMHVRSLDPNGGIAWYQKFIRKGYTRPVEEPEYKIEDIQDDFQIASTIVYTNDSGGSLVTNFDNLNPVPINESSKVAKYTKGGEFANVQIRLDYKMDIRTRNKFTMKVFLPGFNKYSVIGTPQPWQTYNTLQKMVSMKLQNNDLGGNAYTTQAEVKFSDVVTDEWIELTFDFSAYADRTDFDQIVIQIGGEGVANVSGIFYIDDLKLQP